ncbi:hypothetical protein B1NLA3E_02395 [Bacillus sp. 1NLA3E]|nr:hypothetical protein B1NLA3E_02395 [Bacillus sp. 1NLA3E]
MDEKQKNIISRVKVPKVIHHRKIIKGEEYKMKVIRSYAVPNKAVNVQRILQQLIEIEMEKIVNTNSVNSPASHEKITLGGDCA